MSSKCHSNLSTSLPCTCVLCNAQHLHVTPERFKDICLKTSSLSIESSSSSSSPTSNNSGSSSFSSNSPSALHDLNTVLEYFFEPTKKLNSHKNNVDLLKTYLVGTSLSTYENYKAKCKLLINTIILFK